VRAALLGLALLGASGCYQQTRPEPAKLQVIAQPEEARVYVDEAFVASARVLEGRPRRIRPGRHRITITAPGHFPHDVEVDFPAGTTTIRIALRPIPP